MNEHDEQPSEQKSIPTEQRDRLIEVLESLESLTARQVSLKFVLLRGAVYGLGTVIGATILISVLSFLAVQVFGTVTDEQAVEERIDTVLER